MIAVSQSFGTGHSATACRQNVMAGHLGRVANQKVEQEGGAVTEGRQ